MREKAKAVISLLLIRLKADYKFILLILVIVIAALCSLSYAFLRANNDDVTVTDKASTIHAGEYEQFAAVATENDTHGSDSTKQQDPASQPGAKSKPATLGKNIDCGLVNEQASREFVNLKKQLQNPRGDVTDLYPEIVRAYEAYKTDVTSKSCSPTLSLPAKPAKLPYL